MNLTYIFAISTLVLAVAVYACNRAHAPLRKKAKADAIEAAKKRERDEAECRERTRREAFKSECLSILEEALRNPNGLVGLRSSWPHNGYKFEMLVKLANDIGRIRHYEEDLSRLRDTSRKQAELLRANEKHLKEITKALQLGQPIE